MIPPVWKLISLTFWSPKNLHSTILGELQLYNLYMVYYFMQITNICVSHQLLQLIINIIGN